MAKKSFLDSIRSPRPCSKDWNEMIGDEHVRFCQGCEKNVYNLSAMSRKAAQKFVALNAGKVCVRYVRLPDGRVQTSDAKLYKITRRASQLAAGVFGATLTLSAIANAQTKILPKTEPGKSVKSQNKSNAQTSQISFTVFDPNNAVIPNAEVRLINQKTKEEFAILTGQEGIAQFSVVPHGNYDVKVSATFFRNYNFNLQIKEQIEPNINITLMVGVVVGVFVVDDYEIPLFYAIAQENNETVKKIINSDFDVNTKNKSGQTALHIAVERGNLEIVKFLLERGANVNAKDKDRLTPIWKIDSEDESSALEIFRLLLEKGADVNVPNKEKETLLMQACENDSLEGVKILLEAGADPNLKDEDGETALQKTNSDEIKQLLKKYGAKE